MTESSREKASGRGYWPAIQRNEIHPGRLAAFAVLLAALGSTLAGCTGPAGGVAGTLKTMEPLVENCHGPLNGYAGVDYSVSSQGDPDLILERVEAVHDMANQVAACGGYMRVVAFSGSAAETFPLGEAEFSTDRGTETARLIQADKAVDTLIDDVEDSLPEAKQQLDAEGSDVLAQLTLAEQYQAQRSTGNLYVGLVTDGIATTGPVVMNTPSFTGGAARSAGNDVPVPDLGDGTVRIVGIGKTTGARQLSTERIDAITSFYSLACRRTGASCTVATDYAPEGVE